MYTCVNCGKGFDADVVMPFGGSRDEPAHEGWVGVEECPFCGEIVDCSSAMEGERDDDDDARDEAWEFGMDE